MIYGGQIANTPDVENYPGIASISGFEFAQNIYNQAVALGAQVVYETPVAVELEGPVKRVITNQNTYEGRCVIIANGVERRKLGCDGEERLSGRGVSYCACLLYTSISPCPEPWRDADRIPRNLDKR